MCISDLWSLPPAGTQRDKAILRKHNPHEHTVNHDQVTTMSCDPSVVPLHSHAHHPPVVSVPGEAANPGPHEEHDSDDANNEANITLFFGN
eukprot:3713884-Karenia_brevis.AAC.1